MPKQWKQLHHQNQKRQNQSSKNVAKSILTFTPRAPAHAQVVDEKVHVFVDDQNLFYGITNYRYGPDFRIDFGRLLLQACRRNGGVTRSVGSAYIAASSLTTIRSGRLPRTKASTCGAAI